MEWLVISRTLGRGQCKDEALETSVADPGPDDVWEGVVPRSGPAEVPNTFEGVGVELERNREAFLLLQHLCWLF